MGVPASRGERIVEGRTPGQNMQLQFACCHLANRNKDLHELAFNSDSASSVVFRKTIDVFYYRLVFLRTHVLYDSEYINYSFNY